MKSAETLTGWAFGAFYPLSPLAGNAGIAGNLPYNVWNMSETKKVYRLKHTPPSPHHPQSISRRYFRTVLIAGTKRRAKALGYSWPT